jgi:hypothetical protein
MVNLRQRFLTPPDTYVMDLIKKVLKTPFLNKNISNCLSSNYLWRFAGLEGIYYGVVCNARLDTSERVATGLETVDRARLPRW